MDNTTHVLEIVCLHVVCELQTNKLNRPGFLRHPTRF